MILFVIFAMYNLTINTVFIPNSYGYKSYHEFTRGKAPR